jgi:hypothetical protein
LAVSGVPLIDDFIVKLWKEFTPLKVASNILKKERKKNR